MHVIPIPTQTTPALQAFAHILSSIAIVRVREDRIRIRNFCTMQHLLAKSQVGNFKVRFIWPQPYLSLWTTTLIPDDSLRKNVPVLPPSTTTLVCRCHRRT